LPLGEDRRGAGTQPALGSQPQALTPSGAAVNAAPFLLTIQNTFERTSLCPFSKTPSLMPTASKPCPCSRTGASISSSPTRRTSRVTSHATGASFPTMTTIVGYSQPSPPCTASWRRIHSASASMAGRRRTSSCRRIVRRVFVSWDISHFRSDIRRVHVMYATSTNAPTCSLRAIRVTRRTLSVT
jgi:hypothetical protein